jgi:hypothetical protein
MVPAGRLGPPMPAWPAGCFAHRTPAGLVQNEGLGFVDVQPPLVAPNPTFHAYRRLKTLEESGEIESKMAGNSLIWFPVE